MKKVTTAQIAGGIAVAAFLISGVAFAQSVAFTSQLGIGASGSDVTSLQTWLNHNGYYDGPITGYFGVLTRAAVMQYQSANGISSTGYVGPLTLAALNRTQTSITTSSNSSQLSQLQAELASLLAQIQAIESGSSTSIPTGSAASFQTNAGTSFNGTLGATGTGPFTYTLATNPMNGVVTSFNSTTGAFTYMPNANYSGSDSFTYTVRNNNGTSAPVTVNVNVGSNGMPMGQAFSFSTQNGAAYNGTLWASGNTPYTYSITRSPSYGSISNFNSSTGSFTYTPTTNYTGSDSFTYTVTNGAGVSSPVTVTVNNGSGSTSAPIGQTLSYTSTNGASVSGNLWGSGSGTLTYTIASQPMHGIVNSFTPSTGAFTYTPTTNYHGSDSFTYTVANSYGTSAAYTVNLTD